MVLLFATGILLSLRWIGVGIVFSPLLLGCYVVVGFGEVRLLLLLLDYVLVERYPCLIGILVWFVFWWFFFPFVIQQEKEEEEEEETNTAPKLVSCSPWWVGG